MTFERLLFWFGVAHAVAYAVAGGGVLFTILLNDAVRRLGVGRDILRMYGRHLREKQQRERQDRAA